MSRVSSFESKGGYAEFKVDKLLSSLRTRQSHFQLIKVVKRNHKRFACVFRCLRWLILLRSRVNWTRLNIFNLPLGTCSSWERIENEHCTNCSFPAKVPFLTRDWRWSASRGQCKLTIKWIRCRRGHQVRIGFWSNSLLHIDTWPDGRTWRWICSS